MAGTHRLQVAGGGPPTLFLDLRQAAPPATVAFTSSCAKSKKCAGLWCFDRSPHAEHVDYGANGCTTTMP
jgi:hypothetical protein